MWVVEMNRSTFVVLKCHESRTNNWINGAYIGEEGMTAFGLVYTLTTYFECCWRCGIT
jgi:hypothetical protein